VLKGDLRVEIHVISSKGGTAQAGENPGRSQIYRYTPRTARLETLYGVQIINLTASRCKIWR